MYECFVTSSVLVVVCLSTYRLYNLTQGKLPSFIPLHSPPTLFPLIYLFSLLIYLFSGSCCHTRRELLDGLSQ